jgi:uncharacterized membrane protein YdjX (TVP38/TMEM64 family)
MSNGKQAGWGSMWRSKLAAGLALLTVAAAAYVWIWQSGGLDVLGDEQRLTAAIRSLGVWGVVALVLLEATAIVLSPLPSAPIALAAGMVYGTVWGGVIVICGAELGAISAFSLARWLGFDAVRKWSRAEGMMRHLTEETSQFWLMLTVFVARLLPFVSFDAVSYAAGLTPLSFWRFALATLLGVMPVSFLLTFAGEELSGGSLATIGLTLIVLVAVPVIPLLVRFLRRR